MIQLAYISFWNEYQSRITRINEPLDYNVSLHGQEANCDSVYTEHYSLSKKVRKLYYIDSSCRRHPKVSSYRRNGSLKYYYYYYHGKYLYSVKYSRKEEVKRLREKKIDKTVSKFMADSVDTKCHNKLDQNDIKQGFWCDSGFVPDIYNIDGIVSLRVGEYTEGLENGLWKYYHKYGKQLYMTREYKLGKLHGAVTYYNIKGNIVAQYTFINGVKEGVYKSYYDNGQIMVVANFSSNKLSGEYIRYSKNGEVEFKIEDASIENPYER